MNKKLFIFDFSNPEFLVNSGCGGIGRRAGFRFQYFGVRVRVSPSAFLTYLIILTPLNSNNNNNHASF